MNTGLAAIGGAVEINHDAILKSLNLDRRDAKTQALLLVCDRYGLDPLLKHMVLIQGSPYVTRDGYLAVAHRSGQFDGMEVVEQGETQTHYTAKVAVYRKDMGRPFTFIGRFPKSKSMAKEYGPEMAVKVAEVQALRRAFNITGVPAADERWDDDVLPAPEPDTRPVVAAIPRTTPPPTVDAETGEVVTRRRPPPSTEPKPNPNGPAIHAFAANVAKEVGLDEGPLCDAAVLHATGGRTTSANEVTRTERDMAVLWLGTVRDGQLEVESYTRDDGSEGYRASPAPVQA